MVSAGVEGGRGEGGGGGGGRDKGACVPFMTFFTRALGMSSSSAIVACVGVCRAYAQLVWKWRLGGSTRAAAAAA
jgi:hypothetical protein